MDATIGPALAEQFALTWEMLRNAVMQCPDDHWRNGGVPKHVPARWVLHAVEAADAYSSPSPKHFSPGARFGLDWETARPDQLPPREEMLAYLDEVRRWLDGQLRATPDAEFLKGNTRFPWMGATVLAQALYWLRHTQHHVGQLNQILRTQGLTAARWK
jgi:hypothetical protein